MRKLLFVLFFISASLFGVENYKVSIKQFHSDTGQLFLTLRQFNRNAKTFYLVLNTATLQTSIESLEAQQLEPLNDTQMRQSQFGKLLYKATSFAKFGGIREATQPSSGAIFLTMDMCPSQKQGYEKEFLTQLTQRAGKTSIAIAMTSVWLRTHEKEFAELVNNPLLDITWINHTHSHFYDKHLPNEENFMRHSGTNVQEEILGLEQTLIEKGVTPSIFFRFPGLIADASLMKALRQTYFLIPISTHAWVAKGEAIQKGSIILIHGNKNEHQGIVALEQKLPTLTSKFTFKPLREAFVK